MGKNGSHARYWPSWIFSYDHLIPKFSEDVKANQERFVTSRYAENRIKGWLTDEQKETERKAQKRTNKHMSKQNHTCRQ